MALFLLLLALFVPLATNAATVEWGAITTGTTEVVVAGVGINGGNILSAHQINSVNSTVPAYCTANNNQISYRLLTSTFSSGTATATSNSAGYWTCNIVAFKRG
jgi:hypothetical protein